MRFFCGKSIVYRQLAVFNGLLLPNYAVIQCFFAFGLNPKNILHISQNHSIIANNINQESNRMLLFDFDSAFAELHFCSPKNRIFAKDAISYIFVNQQFTPPRTHQYHSTVYPHTNLFNCIDAGFCRSIAADTRCQPALWLWALRVARVLLPIHK